MVPSLPPIRPDPRIPIRIRKSGRPDSNRRRPAWEAGILPTELRPRPSNVPRTPRTLKQFSVRYPGAVASPVETPPLLLSSIVMPVIAVSAVPREHDPIDAPALVVRHVER